MKRKLVNKGWLAGGLLLISAACSAQYRPTVSAALRQPDLETQFYRIPLPPAFVAGCRADLSDLRVYDQEDHETPYVLKIFGPEGWLAGFRPVPYPQIRRQDSSNRHTYFRLYYDDAYLIDWFGFVIENPVLYKRDAVISSLDDGSVVATISIDPADTVFRVRRVKTKGLLIDISNKDNPPLVVRRLVALQSDIYVVALLQAGRRYRLVAGDPTVRAPEYDLHYFTDSLTSAPSTLQLAEVRREKGKAIVAVPEVRGSKTRGAGLLLWGVVAVILLLLIYVSVKMTRAIDKKGKDDHQ